MVVFVIITVSACNCAAQEFTLLGGISQDTGFINRTGVWQLEYNEGFGEHFGGSISYLNEGHLPGHHRDGYSAQLWTRTTLLDRRLSLAAGIGPYYFFDTVTAIGGDSYANDHGWGANLSLAATWYAADRWFLQLRSNLIEASSGPGTLSALIGIGYQLDSSPYAPRPTSPSLTERRYLNELTVYLGGSIANSFDSESSPGMAIEYRRKLLRYLDGSIAWLYEGDKRLTIRNGVSLQLWGTRDFMDEKLSLGIAAGPYFSSDHYHQNNGVEGNFDGVSAILTMAASYRIHPHWSLKTAWNRILTDYNRDGDVIFCGIGYLF